MIFSVFTDVHKHYQSISERFYYLKKRHHILWLSLSLIPVNPKQPLVSSQTLELALSWTFHGNRIAE